MIVRRNGGKTTQVKAISNGRIVLIFPKLSGVGSKYITSKAKFGSLVPFKPGPHMFEFDLNAERCGFLIDGMSIGQITPDQLPDCKWDLTTRGEILCSVEKHGG